MNDWLDDILDKLWKDAWGKLGAYSFDGTGVDTLTKDQAKEAIERIISDQVAKAKGCTSCGKRMCDNCERLWQT